MLPDLEEGGALRCAQDKQAPPVQMQKRGGQVPFAADGLGRPSVQDQEGDVPTELQ